MDENKENKLPTKRVRSEDKPLVFDDLMPKKYNLDALARRVIKEKDPKALSSLVDEFRTVTLKKEVVRLVKLSEFSDLADVEIGKRLSEHPERLKNSELVEFSSLIQNSMDRANKQIDAIRDNNISINASTVNVTKNEVNFNLNTASREKITSVVMSILNAGTGSAKHNMVVPSEEIVVETENISTTADDVAINNEAENVEAVSTIKLKEDED